MSEAGSPSNVRRATLALRAGCAVAVVSAAVWSAWPLGTASHADALSQAQPVKETKTVAPRSLDLAAFRSPLWVAPPPPPAPPAPPPPPPALKLQLIAIVAGASDTDDHSALIYDPDQDKLLTLRRGDSIGGRRVEQVTSQSVQIRDASGPRTLSLRNDQPGGRP